MNITLELISPFVDSVFMAHTAAGVLPLLLTEAKELPRRGLPHVLTHDAVIVVSALHA